MKKGRPHRGSNTGQHDLQSYALTTELWSLKVNLNICSVVLAFVEIGGQTRTRQLQVIYFNDRLFHHGRRRDETRGYHPGQA